MILLRVLVLSLAVRLCFRVHLGNGCGHILDLTPEVLPHPQMGRTWTDGNDASVVVVVQDYSTMTELTLH